MLSLAQLIAAGINPTVARTFLPHLLVAFERFEINTPRRIAAFIGQYSHETSGFTRLEENLYYTDPARIARMFSALRNVDEARAFTRHPKALANKVYANRNGNGDEASGDGWDYRGRALPHLTGRGNYSRAADALGLPLVTEPDRASEPDAAALIGGWYWHSNGLNAHADRWDLALITRGINGKAMAGHADRVERCSRALDAMLNTAPQA